MEAIFILPLCKYGIYTIIVLIALREWPVRLLSPQLNILKAPTLEKYDFLGLTAIPLIQLLLCAPNFL